jgi:PadR family transcriptional regulator, regulatory protein AphA
MSRGSTLSTTSYAILGLLAVQPWSTYELARQMDRSLGRLWPRAKSKLYEEPKKLVEHGLARARTEVVGRRPRTVYTITPKGRRALARWLKEPGAGPSIEFEGLLKLTFAENGTKSDALASIAAAREWAVERNAENLATARRYLAGTGAFQQRAAVNMIGGAFLTDFYAMVAAWADWAETVVASWPDDPADAQADVRELRRIVRHASWSEQGLHPVSGFGG